MRRPIALVLPLFLFANAATAEVDPKIDRVVREALPVCSDSKIVYGELPIQLPPRFKGTLVRVESPRPVCEGQYAAVLSPAGSVFVGMPWPIERAEGRTVEEKLRDFAWRNLQENMTATVDRTRTDEGFFRVTLAQVTEAGRMPMQGVVDPEGKVFFMGQFHRGDVRKGRLESLKNIIATSPTAGPADAPVTVIEFSDFQCPSCKRTAHVADMLRERYKDKVRYVRADLPLSGHAWAFPAALAGRAIYKQKPELFWEYKKQVYANQQNLNAFVFWDWARGFAEDNGLDLARYDAALESDSLRNEILAGAGTGFSTDVRATPSFMVNGAFVDPTDEGMHLFAYIDSLLK